jgi:hypothetical protein
MTKVIILILAAVKPESMVLSKMSLRLFLNGSPVGGIYNLTDGFNPFYELSAKTKETLIYH